MRKYILFVLFGLAAPTAANAQLLKSERFSIEPYAGAYHDPYDIGNDDNDIGLFGGLRASYELGLRTSLFANVAYAKTDDVAFSSDASNRQVVNNEWAHTTAGFEFDLLRGATNIAAGLETGVLWRSNTVARELGTPVPGHDFIGARSWASYGVVVPSLVLRQQLGSRVSLAIRAADYLFPGGGGVAHGPAAAFGLSLH
jgi:hypothetical protein